MKTILISDTHGQHRSLKLPKGELIIHAGDVSGRGKLSEITDFLDWFSKLKFKYKVFIAGNHDFFFEQTHPDVIGQMIPDNVIYLNDSGCKIEGLKLWGSPITPWFNNWAFNRGRGKEISQHWDLVPDDTDVLITHGPPYGFLDETVYRDRTGCEDLLLKVRQLKPRLHVFGHIHEAYGQLTDGKTTFVNASILNERYELVNHPIVLSIADGI